MVDRRKYAVPTGCLQCGGYMAYQKVSRKETNTGLCLSCFSKPFDEDRCTAMNRAEKRCGLRVKAGNNMCGTHLRRDTEVAKR